jgi:methionyl aminopeptidase
MGLGRGIPRRSPDDLRHMRAAGRVVAEMHERIRAAARPGVTTAHLDRVAAEVIDRRNASSNFLGYHGYPAVICASVNEQLVHGIPGPRVLREGDLLSVDCGAIVNGWHGDAAFSMLVGDGSEHAVRLLHTAEAALAAAIERMRPGNRLGDVGWAIDRVVSAAGYGSPRDYCGHGIGRAMHEDPDVENRGRAAEGPNCTRVWCWPSSRCSSVVATTTWWCSTTTGRSSPPTARWLRTWNTRCWWASTAPRSSPRCRPRVGPLIVTVSSAVHPTATPRSSSGQPGCLGSPRHGTEVHWQRG